MVKYGTFQILAMERKLFVPHHTPTQGVSGALEVEIFLLKFLTYRLNIYSAYKNEYYRNSYLDGGTLTTGRVRSGHQEFKLDLECGTRPRGTRLKLGACSQFDMGRSICTIYHVIIVWENIEKFKRILRHLEFTKVLFAMENLLAVKRPFGTIGMNWFRFSEH